MITQKQRILHYISEFGSITPMDAFNDLGITKLATRVSELRRDGKIIVGTMEKSRNRYGQPVDYMRYSFEVKEVEK